MKSDSVSVYLQIRLDTPLSLYAPAHISVDLPSFPQLRTY